PADAGLLIRLRHGAAGGAAFVRQMRAAGLGGVDIPEVQQVQTAGIQRSIRLESQALWALSVLIGLAAFAIEGQSLARQTYLDSADLLALWALGFSRAQLFALGIARAAIIGTAAACVVAGMALAGRGRRGPDGAAARPGPDSGPGPLGDLRRHARRRRRGRLAGAVRQPRPPAGHPPAVRVHLGRLRIGRRRAAQ